MNIPTPCFTGLEADEAERMGALFAAIIGGTVARTIRPPGTDEEVALAEALRRHPLRRVEYQTFRVRSDATTVLWGHQARTHPTETVDLIQYTLNQAITDEAKIAGVLDILAKSLLAGERVP